MSAALSSQAARRNRSLAKVTAVLVLATESVFFGTLLMVYLAMRQDQANWPFMNATLSQLVVPVANTVILALSALLVYRSVRAIQRGVVSALKTSLEVAFALGLIFVAGQIFEFNRSGLQPNDPAFGGVFFALIGFHALHVLAGLVVIAVNSVRARLGDFSAHQYLAVEIGAWFWYYVVGVWLLLFTALYLV
jgi:cytochrome c oxidase subunit 3